MKYTIEQINRLNRKEFTEALGSVFEHSPWVAELSYDLAPFESAEELHRAMAKTMRSTTEQQLLALLRAHPNLATRLQISELSTSEQAGAGLDQLTEEEFERFSELNQVYMSKFEFPFILAVKGKGKTEIMEAMKLRIQLSKQEEWEQALKEIEKITRFRIYDLVVG